MSLNAQKIPAVAGLGAVVGGIAGWFVAPLLFVPVEPDVLHHDFELSFGGSTTIRCGQVFLAQAISGGLVGSASGLLLGLALAWCLPTPKDPA